VRGALLVVVLLTAPLAHAQTIFNVVQGSGWKVLWDQNTTSLTGVDHFQFSMVCAPPTLGSPPCTSRPSLNLGKPLGTADVATGNTTFTVLSDPVIPVGNYLATMAACTTTDPIVSCPVSTPILVIVNPGVPPPVAVPAPKNLRVQ
jgi:hypothetical protein